MKSIMLVFLSQFFAVVHLTPLGYANGYGYSAGHSGHYSSVVTPFEGLGDSVNNKITAFINSKAINVVTPFPDSGRQKAVLEQEHWLSQLDTKYSQLQNTVGNFFHVKPLIDTISEHEKYGNDGGKIRKASIALVGGVEAISNKLNAAVDAPFTATRQVGKQVTNTLNMIGSKLVGLSK